MFNPLVSDLTHLKDDELTKKIGELQKRLSQCWKFGPMDLIPQLQTLVNQYYEEQSRRNAKALEEINKRSSKNGKDFDGIINIQ